ncbi:tripartite tricarboxylate transporter TctB family protein [Leucobacter sp. CSA1]|uniref:Tripartite tricarboxylate transporter TctB family protein n=1 Tax=Leucobacter chromiisoli TaxID=2796471 RepID=A0A934UTJ9_9MICO|nr:tripartite tricarboxylate transporter TctB family protein [Leucobacter chromiisoli]MBK0417441.1 tripartite tricarboxylate transporter TctB family protein [Leucobacter chromiisoli]
MMPSNNPTAASAVVGEELEIGTGSTAALLKNLIMPVVLIAFATYLLIGIVTMRVPEGTAFPGPQFFPGLITAGLYLFAVLLIVSTIREHRAAAEARRVLTEELELILEEDEAAGADGSGSRTGRSVGVDWRSLAWIVGSFLVFSLTLQFLGWIVGSALLFWCVARGFGSTRPFFSLVVGLTVASLSYIAFDMMLGLSLPSGVLGWGF